LAGEDESKGRAFKVGVIMNANKARALAKKKAVIPQDLLRMIKNAARNGLTGIAFVDCVRNLSTLERCALELHGYNVHSTCDNKQIKTFHIQWN
jgi:hypothetical protein